MMAIEEMSELTKEICNRKKMEPIKKFKKARCKKRSCEGK
jgi:hypothetical protein